VLGCDARITFFVIFNKLKIWLLIVAGILSGFAFRCFLRFCSSSHPSGLIKISKDCSDNTEWIIAQTTNEHPSVELYKIECKESGKAFDLNKEGIG
jgi:hypothetical protein